MPSVTGRSAWRNCRRHRLPACAAGCRVLSVAVRIATILGLGFGLRLACGIIASIWVIKHPPLFNERVEIGLEVGAQLLIVFVLDVLMIRDDGEYGLVRP